MLSELKIAAGGDASHRACFANRLSDRLRHDFGSERSYEVQCQGIALNLSCRQAEHRITIEQGMRWTDRLCETILRHLSHFINAFLVKLCVCGDDADNGVGRGRGWRP